MALNDLIPEVAYIIALLCMLAATVPLCKHLGNICVDKLEKAEKLKFQRRKNSASIRHDRQ